MTNSADPDQLASSEANWSGSALFAKTGHVVFSKIRFSQSQFFFFFFFLLIYIATAKREYLHDIFLISPQKNFLWYSLEVPQWGNDNIFFFEKKKKEKKEKYQYLLVEKCAWSDAMFYIQYQDHPARNYPVFSLGLWVSVSKLKWLWSIHQYVGAGHHLWFFSLSHLQNLLEEFCWNLAQASTLLSTSFRKSFFAWCYKLATFYVMIQCKNLLVLTTFAQKVLLYSEDLKYFAKQKKNSRSKNWCKLCKNQ